MGKEAEKNERKIYTINVEEYAKFRPMSEVAVISSKNFCKLVSDLFSGVFSDYEGCKFSFWQNRPEINLIFNQRDIVDDKIPAATSRMKQGTSNTSNALVDAIRDRDNFNRNGDRYYLTEQGINIVSQYVMDNFINPRNGNIDFNRIVVPVSEQETGVLYQARSIQYTMVQHIDVLKLASIIWGPTREDGNTLTYAIECKGSVPNVQRNVPGVYFDDFVLKVTRIFNNNLEYTGNEMGMRNMVGSSIIRPQR